MTIKHEFSLDAKYRQEEGTVLLSGIQALVRLPLDQHRADKRRGLNTATLISGYRGSPLGGLDITLERNPDLLRDHNVVFISGLNEDLGATAVYGAGLANLFPNPKYDGVLGMWYGKGPGVDRTGDIFKHANYAGIGRYGGVLALGGDDPLSKSSTLPTHSEVAFYDAFFPVIFPGNVQEILDFGRLGFELSRYCGLWVGFKIVTNVADEIGTAQVGADRVVISDPGFLYEGKPWRPTQNPALLPPFGLELEREIHYGRLQAAKAFAAAHPFNEITVPTENAWLGIAAPGKAYYDLREALRELGLDDASLRRYGIRLMRIGLLFPMETGIVREFSRGLQELLVIEEKRSFVELFIRDALYNVAERPRVVGKEDESGRPLVPANGELDADRIAQIVARRIESRISLPSITARVALLEALRERPAPLTLARQPFFCSGCPHNRSTVVPEGSLAGGGIGCHGMALMMPERRTIGTTHMGGEGVHWVGMAPFTNTKHMFQNLGDGTFFHSGSLAIRQAVAAGTNITFKILYNSAVAMTGGQDAAGAMPVPDMTRLLEAEGVKRIIVTTDQTDKYGGDAQWGRGAEVWHRDRLDEAQRLLRDINGVTVLIHDQRCAAEKRRLRKRGKLEDPALRVFINEAVCEGCGDCGVKSNCLSVQPVDTEFGRKTRIHQSSCNKDYSCLNGDCPSFLTVVPIDGTRKERKLFKVEHALPEPELKVSRDAAIYMMGIGGTGVVTVNQILATAALLDGKHVRGLDQTGLSQKGGPVVSHLKITERPEAASNKVAAGESDCYLGFDVLVATSPVNLDHARPDKTIAVVSTSRVPTGAMVTHTDVHFPEAAGLQTAIDRFTRKDENVYLDALGLAETLFDDHMAANMIVLGAAYQAGAIPVASAAIEEAIVLNGVSVAMNTHAFRAGRLLVADPAWVKTIKRQRVGTVETPGVLTAQARSLVDTVQAEGELRRLLEIRVPELIDYQNEAYARQYVDVVARVRAAERRVADGQTRLSEAVARHLFKLMAYKDEYEVARLHLRQDVARALEAQFPGGVRVQYNLHPPILRALGWKKKIRLGTWFDGAFRLLRAMKGLRGTALDPFGRAEVRRVERALIGEYQAQIDKAVAGLTPATYATAVKLANLPDMIRGYEDIKLRNVLRYREELKTLGM